jgi:phosphoglucosamine mutase
MGLFGTSGIRRLFDDELLGLALMVGLAVGKSSERVVVGRDTRTSSDALKHAVVAGLLAAGSPCEDAGVVPTPTIGYVSRNCAAGVMVTASHNPREYNGLKLINPDGSAFDAAQRQRLKEMVERESWEAASWKDVKDCHLYEGAIEQHLERVGQDFPDKLKLKVVLDCGCGAASAITPSLLRRLGCGVVEINCQPSGFFPRGLEPNETNLKDLMKVVIESGADLGIAHDGDADRMMAVDERGRFIPGDKLLAMLARSLKAREVVTTLDASMILEEFGFRLRRTRIGDMYVSEELKNGGDFGGEPSGSWIFPGVSLCPDGIYATAQIANIASQKKLSELADGMPAYPLFRGSVSHDGITMSGLEPSLLALEPEPLSVDRSDGLRLNFLDGWLLVRPSGTEPKVRLTAEAKTERRARDLYEKGEQAVQNYLAREDLER